MILSCIIIIILNFKEVSKWTIIAIILLFTVGSFHALYFSTPKYILVPIYFSLSLLIISIMDYKSIDRLIKLSTNFMFLLLFGAIIGCIYAFIGGEPIWTIVNESREANNLYLTTFSNTEGWIAGALGEGGSSGIGNIIRPTGIYDEPGAFSFYLCSLVAIRELFGKSKRTSFLILFLGFITLSLAHLIFFTFYCMHLFLHKIKNMSFRNKKLMFNYKNFALGMLFISLLIPTFEILNDKVISRLAFRAGRMVGDNRSERMLNTLSMINQESLLVGIGPGGVIAGVPFDRSKVGVFGENPFTLLTSYGIILSLPYYLAIIILFMNGIKYRLSLILFPYMLLLLQRPNIFAFGYTFVIILIVYWSYKVKRASILQNYKRKILFW